MNSQKTYSIHVREEGGGKTLLSLSGRLEIGNLHLFLSEANGLLQKISSGSLRVDLSKVEDLDSAEALGLLQLEDRVKNRSITLQFVNVTEEAKRIVGLINREALSMKPLASEKRSNLIEQIGEGSLRILNDFVSIMTFLGDLLTALARSFLHPRAVRLEDLGLNVTFLDLKKRETAEKVIFQRDYKAVEPYPERPPAALARGMSRAMEKISRQIILDLQDAVKNR